MNSKREEERIEKIIRGLQKLPPNRKCINCNSLGPQYVCINFWTFVCTACSGIHREFTHRVKSVSMAKFTKQEVEALQRGGNQRARELFLSDWDAQRMRLPDSSNPDKIREFIKNVYVDKKYAGGRSHDKPPKDTQSARNHEDHRRASSYHSFSQSPPYDHQYGERHYGKNFGMLTRRPGSDRGLYEGKMSSFVYSPGRSHEQMYEDRFANESTSSRMSDFSIASDPCRYGGQSPGFQENGYSSPPSQQVRDFLAQDSRSRSNTNLTVHPDGILLTHGTMSSGSFGSVDSNSVSLKSVNSGSLGDIVLEHENSGRNLQADLSVPHSALPTSATAHLTSSGPFIHSYVQSPATPSVDLFAAVNRQPSPTALSQDNHPTAVHQNIDLFAYQSSSPTLPHNKPVAVSQSIDLFSDGTYQHSTVTLSQDKPVVLPQIIDLFADGAHKHSSVTSCGKSVVVPQTVDLLVDDTYQHSSVILSQNKPNTLTQSIDLFPSPKHQSATLSLNKEIAGPQPSDLFADVSDQYIAAAISEKKPSVTLPDENEGWATFDVLCSVRPATGESSVPSAILPSDNGAFKESQNAFAAIHSTHLFSVQSATGGPATGVADQWLTSASEIKQQPGPQASELWNAFDGFAPGNTSQNLFQSIPSQREVQVSLQKPQLSGNNISQKTPEDVANGFQKTTASDALSGFNFMHDSAAGSSISHALLPIQEMFVQDRKTSNPFDLPFDTEVEAKSPFLDMSSLQGALPSPQLPNGVLDGLPEPWFAPAGVDTYAPSMPTGLTYMASQSSQLPSAPSLGPVASLGAGGNPFA